tara:strand:+ start:323 stop:451 length:129 start_codon:yes stop_codon:yes gene_type:complete
MPGKKVKKRKKSKVKKKMLKRKTRSRVAAKSSRVRQSGGSTN